MYNLVLPTTIIALFCLRYFFTGWVAQSENCTGSRICMQQIWSAQVICAAAETPHGPGRDGRRSAAPTPPTKNSFSWLPAYLRAKYDNRFHAHHPVGLLPALFSSAHALIYHRALTSVTRCVQPLECGFGASAIFTARVGGRGAFSAPCYYLYYHILARSLGS